MRFLAVFLFLLVAGFGWALWQGIDLIAAQLEEAIAEDSTSPVVENVELTAAEQPPGLLEAVSEPAGGDTAKVTSEFSQRLAEGDTAEAVATPALVPEGPAIPSLGGAAETANTSEEIALIETPEASAAIVAGSPSSALALQPTAQATIGSKILSITGDQVNLRQGAGVGSASLGLLSLDDSVQVLEAQGDWLRVRTEDGQEGWVAARFVAADPG